MKKKKPWEKIRRKWQKLTWTGLDKEREREKAFWKVWINWRTREKSLFKKLFERFLIGQKLDSIDRKSISIDPAPIEHRLSQADCNQNFYRIFDQSSNRFDWSKFWKKQIFEKQSILMQNLLKTQCFMNKMHEYEMKFFSKTLEFNPDLPKTRFSINLSSKFKH